MENLRTLEIDSNLAKALLNRLREQRADLRRQLADREAECLASAPHGYLTCQTQYSKLTEAIDEIDREMAALSRALRLREQN